MIAERAAAPPVPTKRASGAGEIPPLPPPKVPADQTVLTDGSPPELEFDHTIIAGNAPPPPGQKPSTEVEKAKDVALETAFLTEDDESFAELLEDSDEEAAVKPPPPPQEVAAEDAFDLGLPDLPDVDAPEAGKAAGAGESDDLEFDFDFDIDVDNVDALPAPAGTGARQKTALGPGNLPAPAYDENLPKKVHIRGGQSGSGGGGIRSPLLVDVTPRSLGIVTAGGYCHEVIERNAPIPAAESDIFTTSSDNQTNVRVTIYQGEGRMIRDNQELGSVELLKLKRAPRGQVKINVTFMIDENGMLGVKAEDLSTGKEQTIRVSLNAQLKDKEVQQARKRQSAAG
jgi:hypothetical protein